FSTDTDAATEAAKKCFPQLEAMEFSDNARPFLKMVGTYQKTTAITDRIARLRDDTVPDRALRLRKNPRGAGAAEELATLRQLAPECPIGIAAAVELNWAEVAPLAREWEQRYSRYPEVIRRLARQYEQSEKPEDAERCLVQLTIADPDAKSFQALANFYEER